MSAPVDVLAVMRDDAIRAYEHDGDLVTAGTMTHAKASELNQRRDEARAAVAELADKANTVATALSNLIAARQVDERYGHYVTDLTTALASIGGAA